MLAFLQKLANREPGQELGRNATIGVLPEVIEHLRSALAVRTVQLGSLQDILCPDGSPLPTADPLGDSQQLQGRRHFELVDLEHGKHVCMVCGESYTDAWLLRQHQVDFGHFNTDNPAELAFGRKKEQLKRYQTLQRLQDEISGSCFEFD